MPLPERYLKEVSDVVSLWTGKGYFEAQGEVWLARCKAEHDKTSKPTEEELTLIRRALILSPEEIDFLTRPEGHETNRYLRLGQAKLPSLVGNYLHKGMTSSDLLDTALALQIIRSLNILEADFHIFADSLLTMAAEHRLTLQVGRTHGQHAIPLTFGRKAIGWYAEITRGLDRIHESQKVIAYGKYSGEVGTNVNIDPKLEDSALEILNLKADQAPTQIISRDRHAQVALNMAINAATLGRIDENIQALGRTEIGEVREPFDPKSQQGSSSMPHKQNTELSERDHGITDWVEGAAFAVLRSMRVKDERDISHSSTERFAYQDIFGGLAYATRLMIRVIKGARVYPDRMLVNLNLTKGAIYSPRFLNELLEKDTRPRTEIYDHVRDLVLRAMDEGKPLLELVSQDPQIQKFFRSEELVEFFKPDFYLRNIGTAWKRLGLKDPAETQT